MAIPVEWQRFITEYGVDDVYWYFPKGATPDTDDFREKFRIFDLFEGEAWTPDTQRGLATELRSEGLSKGGDDLPRQIKRVFENLGLCWIEDNAPIRITPAGKSYLDENPGRSKVLDAQVWRYQMPNPVNASPATEGIELHPHAFLVEALLNCDGEISGDEFVLFVSRARTQAALKGTIEYIRAWRNLNTATKTEIFAALKSKTNYSTIDADHTYSMAFHHCDLLLRRGRDGLNVDGERLDELKRRLAKHKGVSEIIEFRNEPDCIASYGDTETHGTQIDALDYYINVSDVEKAVKIFRKLPVEVRGELTPEEFQEAQFLEKDLEDHLEKHLDKIEPGLTLIDQQYSTKVGPIDLYAQAKNGDLVVIELKKGRASDKVFGQICRYMGCIKAEQPTKAPKKVRGYIIGREIDEKLHYAAKVVDSGLIGLQVFDLSRARRVRKTGSKLPRLNPEHIHTSNLPIATGAQGGDQHVTGSDRLFGALQFGANLAIGRLWAARACASLGGITKLRACRLRRSRRPQ